jgi:hypothetical protein
MRVAIVADRMAAREGIGHQDKLLSIASPLLRVEFLPFLNLTGHENELDRYDLPTLRSIGFTISLDRQHIFVRPTGVKRFECAERCESEFAVERRHPTVIGTNLDAQLIHLVALRRFGQCQDQSLTVALPSQSGLNSHGDQLARRFIATARLILEAVSPTEVSKEFG